jgi:hypothetical protein
MSADTQKWRQVALLLLPLLLLATCTLLCSRLVRQCDITACHLHFALCLQKHIAACIMSCLVSAAVPALADLLLLLLLQWLFIVEGVPSVAAGLAMLAWLPSHPLTAVMLTKQEAEALHAQVGSSTCHRGACGRFHDALYIVCCPANPSLQQCLPSRRQRRCMHR